MDITSSKLLKIKGVLFLVLGILSGVLLFLLHFDIRQFILFIISIWAFCRAYYFCFYVLHQYVDPNFRYAGLLSMIQHLRKKDKKAE